MVQEAFIARMKPGFENSDKSRTMLQVMIDDTIEETLELDRECESDAGRVMIDLMLHFFTRPPPPASYNNMEEFLLYRHEDAAIP